MIRKFTLLLGLVFVMGQAAYGQYCSPFFGFGGCWAGDDIKDLTIGSFSYTNAPCPAGNALGYSDLSSTIISVNAGSSIPLHFNSTNPGMYYAIWIDFNNDQDFDDAGEFVWNSTAGSSASGTTSSMVLSGANTGSFRLRVKAKGSVYASTESCLWGWQETRDYTILINAAGGCGVPTSFGVTSITPYSVGLDWDSVGTTYDVEYGLAGFTSGTGTVVSKSQDSAIVMGLTPNTAYDFYVRQDCGASTSSYNGPITAHTACIEVSSFPYSEDFDGTDWVPNSSWSQNTDTISECWDRLPAFAWNYTWQLRTGPTGTTASGPDAGYGGSGNYMHVEGSNGSAGDTAIFETPIFDMTSTVEPTLSFYYHMYGEDMGTLYVQVSSDAGATWSTVDSLVGEQQLSGSAAWLPRTVDLTTYKSTTTQVRFIGKSAGWGEGDIAIDEVSIDEAPACPMPTGVTISNITGTQAQVSWTSPATGTYVIEYGQVGFTQGTGVIDTVSGAQNAVITPLIGDELYDVYVLNDCSDSASGYSVWAGPYTFRTHITPEWLEDFDGGFLPDNRWSESEGVAMTPNTMFTSTYASWTQDGFLNNGNSGAVRINISAWGTVEDWFFTPTFDLGSGNNYELYFDLGVTTAGGAAAIPMEADDTLMVVISTDNGATWSRANSIYSIHSGSNTSNLGSSYAVSLSGYNGLVKIGFYMESQTPSTTSYDLHIDNLGIRVPATCPQPTGLFVNNVTDTDLWLHWSGPSNGTAYRIEYGPRGFGQGTGTTVTTAGAVDSINITGLTPVTMYDFYLMAECGPADSSIWVGPLTALTGCPAVHTTPYFASFEEINDGNPVGGNFENCWVASQSNTSLYRWVGQEAPANTWNSGPEYDHTTGTDGGKFAQVYSSSFGYEAEMVGGPFDLSTLTQPTFNFWYHMYGTDINALHVDISTDGMTWTNGAWTLEGEQQTDELDLWSRAAMPLSQYVNDTIWVRFRAERGDGSYGRISIDDISIVEQTVCIPVAGLFANNISTTGADLNWSSFANNYAIEWGLEGFDQATGLGTMVTTTSNSTTLTGLTPNTSYDFFVLDSCTNNWVGPMTFTTECTSALSGAYTVGSTPGATNFATLDSAVSVLNSCGVSGPVTLTVYGGHESTYDFGIIPGASATNLVTIKGTGNGNDSILGFPGGAYGVKLDGTGYVTFEDIFIDHSRGDGYTVWLFGGAHHITFDNVTFMAEWDDPNSTTGNLIASNRYNSLSGQGNNAHDITVSNSHFSGGYAAISIYGDQSNLPSGFVISENTFELVEYYSIRMQYVADVQILKNTIGFTTATYPTSSISISTGDNVDVIGNMIHSANRGMYLYRVETTGGEASEIYNNMIVSDDDGIYMSYTNNMQMYHNSINSLEAALYSTNTGDSVSVMNNILVGADVALYHTPAIAATSTFDYNVYQGNTSLVQVDFTSHVDLLSWQTSDPANNVNSLEGNPGFYASDDLHLRGTLANDAGYNGLTISEDIDGDARPWPTSTTVDIGADEYEPLYADMGVTALYEPFGSCGDSLVDVSVIITNFGLTTQTGFDVDVQVSGGLTASLSTTYAGSLAQFEQDTVTVGQIITYNGGTNVVFTASTQLTGDEFTSNDTVVYEGFNFTSAIVEAMEVDTVCASQDSVMLHANVQAGTYYSWYASDTATTPLANGNSVSLPVSGAPYYLGVNTYGVDSIGHGYSSSWGGGGGVMFDLIAKRNISLDSLNIHSNLTPASTGTLDIYIIPNGTYKGNEANPDAWTFVEQITFTSSGPNIPTKVVLTDAVEMYAGLSYGVYLYYSANYGSGWSAPPVYNSILFDQTLARGLFGEFTPSSANQVPEGAVFVSEMNCAVSRDEVDVPVNNDTAVATFAHINTGARDYDFDAAGSNGHVYDWDFGDGNSGAGMMVSHTYSAGGAYTVTLTVTDTVCGTTDIFTQTVNVTWGLGEIDNNSLITVFPNPTSGLVKVTADLEGDATVLLIDNLGRIVERIESPRSASLDVDLDLSSLPKGIYMVRVIADSKTYTQKVVLQ
ncbi:MAG: hypothetical protein SchgKO_00150 [Schleiferiaceae bacterium]